jgi:hypothetical protein
VLDFLRLRIHQFDLPLVIANRGDPVRPHAPLLPHLPGVLRRADRERAGVRAAAGLPITIRAMGAISIEIKPIAFVENAAADMTAVGIAA